MSRRADPRDEIAARLAPGGEPAVNVGFRRPTAPATVLGMTLRLAAACWMTGGPRGAPLFAGACLAVWALVIVVAPALVPGLTPHTT